MQERRSVVAKYMRGADANLDGMVNADDYGRIDRGFISQEPGWQSGDFNYDDIINADDYGMIDRAFIAQTSQLSQQRLSPSPSKSITEHHGILSALFSDEPLLAS